MQWNKKGPAITWRMGSSRAGSSSCSTALSAIAGGALLLHANCSSKDHYGATQISPRGGLPSGNRDVDDSSPSEDRSESELADNGSRSHHHEGLLQTNHELAEPCKLNLRLGDGFLSRAASGQRPQLEVGGIVTLALGPESCGQFEDRRHERHGDCYGDCDDYDDCDSHPSDGPRHGAAANSKSSRTLSFELPVDPGVSHQARQWMCAHVDAPLANLEGTESSGSLRGPLPVPRLGASMSATQPQSQPADPASTAASISSSDSHNNASDRQWMNCMAGHDSCVKDRQGVDEHLGPSHLDSSRSTQMQEMSYPFDVSEIQRCNTCDSQCGCGRERVQGRDSPMTTAVVVTSTVSASQPVIHILASEAFLEDPPAEKISTNSCSRRNSSSSGEIPSTSNSRRTSSSNAASSGISSGGSRSATGSSTMLSSTNCCSSLRASAGDSEPLAEGLNNNTPHFAAAAYAAADDDFKSKYMLCDGHTDSSQRSTCSCATTGMSAVGGGSSRSGNATTAPEKTTAASDAGSTYGDSPSHTTSSITTAASGSHPNVTGSAKISSNRDSSSGGSTLLTHLSARLRKAEGLLIRSSSFEDYLARRRDNADADGGIGSRSRSPCCATNEGSPSRTTSSPCLSPSPGLSPSSSGTSTVLSPSPLTRARRWVSASMRGGTGTGAAMVARLPPSPTRHRGSASSKHKPQPYKWQSLVAGHVARRPALHDASKGYTLETTC